MAAIDVMARIRSVALAAIDSQCMGEDIGFDTQLLINAGPVPGAGYALVFTRKSPLIGRGPMGQVLMVNSPAPSDTDIEQAVTAALRELAAQSRKILAGTNGSAAARPAPA